MEDGWGLATDGKIIYGCDGTSTMYQIDPETLKVTRKHVIEFNFHVVHYLNELEYVNGEIWANVWQTDCIARISPNNGKILGWILLQTLREGLITARYKGIDVLNGIAWDSNNNRIIVTGKQWPKLYKIKLHPVKKLLNIVDIEQDCFYAKKIMQGPLLSTKTPLLPRIIIALPRTMGGSFRRKFRRSR